MLKRRIAGIDALEATINKKIKKLPTSPPLSDFPFDVLKWMNENANPKMALKLMQICKYFQHQEFPYFIIRHLIRYNKGWRYTTIDIPYRVKNDFNIISKKLWITGSLNFIEKPSRIMEFLLRKIAVCDIKRLCLFSQIDITFYQFKILVNAGTIKTLILNNSVIKNENDEAVPLEDILECCPNLTNLEIGNKSNTIVSHQKATEIGLQQLRLVKLTYYTEPYNLDECFKFIQNNQKIYFVFECRRLQSNEFMKNLQMLTNNLIKVWSPKNKPPHIYFKQQTTKSKEKLKKLEKLFEDYTFAKSLPPSVDFFKKKFDFLIWCFLKKWKS